MGPYRHNAAPLRARREELRVELDELHAKMTELSIARDVVDRAIDDIDVRLQTGFRPPRRRSPRRRLVLPFFIGAVVAIATLFMIGAALQARSHSRCTVIVDAPPRTLDGLSFSDVRRYP